MVPRPVVKKLERAVDLRHRCASRFDVSIQETAALAGNQSHQHFIKVLDNALVILRPLCRNYASFPPRKTTFTDDNDHLLDDEHPLKLENRFQSLAVEVEKEEEDLEVLVQLGNGGKAGKDYSEETKNFVPEEQSRDDEFMLGCFCFFQDLQEIRCFLQDLWQRYNHKQVTLVVASTVTAIDFVRRAEETL